MESEVSDYFDSWIRKYKNDYDYEEKEVIYGQEKISIPSTITLPKQELVKGDLSGQDARMETDYRMELPDDFQNIFTAR